MSVAARAIPPTMPVRFVDLDRADPDSERAHHFVCATWTKNFFEYRPTRLCGDSTRARDKGEQLEHRRMGATAFGRVHPRLVDAILARPSTRVRLAKMPGAAEAGDLVLGWACWELPTATTPARAHYLYVDKTFRGFRVGAALMAEMVGALGTGGLVEYTHWTPRIAQLHPPADWVWNEWGAAG